MDIKLSEGEDGVPFIKLGEGMLRLDLEELDEAYQERSRIELRETPENIAHGLEKLKELIKGKHFFFFFILFKYSLCNFCQ